MRTRARIGSLLALLLYGLLFVHDCIPHTHEGDEQMKSSVLRAEEEKGHHHHFPFHQHREGQEEDARLLLRGHAPAQAPVLSFAPEGAFDKAPKEPWGKGAFFKSGTGLCLPLLRWGEAPPVLDAGPPGTHLASLPSMRGPPVPV